MLRLILLMCLAVQIHAAPCALALLSTYIAGGCSNQGVSFDGWAYTPGGSSIGAGDILVTPSVAAPYFEFHVISGGWTAGPGEVITPTISTLATGATSVVASQVFLAFGTGTGTAMGSATLETCSGDLLPVCASGVLSVVTALSTGPILANGPIPPGDPIDMRLSLFLSGGTGIAYLETVNAGLFATPEPPTAALLLPVLAAFWWGNRRASRY